MPRVFSVSSKSRHRGLPREYEQAMNKQDKDNQTSKEQATKM
jgi:hypothetical protein